jgi:hypothetical protein
MSSSPEADKIIRAWGMDNLKRTEQRLPKVSAIALKEEHALVLKLLKVLPVVRAAPLVLIS